MSRHIADLTEAVCALPDAQRVALMNQMVRGIEDLSCVLPLCRLHRHVGTIIDELSRERDVRDHGPRPRSSLPMRDRS